MRLYIQVSTAGTLRIKGAIADSGFFIPDALKCALLNNVLPNDGPVIPSIGTRNAMKANWPLPTQALAIGVAPGIAIFDPLAVDTYSQFRLVSAQIVWGSLLAGQPTTGTGIFYAAPKWNSGYDGQINDMAEAPNYRIDTFPFNHTTGLAIRRILNPQLVDSDLDPINVIGGSSQRIEQGMSMSWPFLMDYLDFKYLNSNPASGVSSLGMKAAPVIGSIFGTSSNPTWLYQPNADDYMSTFEDINHQISLTLTIALDLEKEYAPNQVTADNDLYIGLPRGFGSQWKFDMRGVAKTSPTLLDEAFTQTPEDIRQKVYYPLSSVFNGGMNGVRTTLAPIAQVPYITTNNIAPGPSPTATYTGTSTTSHLISTQPVNPFVLQVNLSDSVLTPDWS